MRTLGVHNKTAFLVEHSQIRSYLCVRAVCKDNADSADGARLGATVDALCTGDGDRTGHSPMRFWQHCSLRSRFPLRRFRLLLPGIGPVSVASKRSIDLPCSSRDSANNSLDGVQTQSPVRSPGRHSDSGSTRHIQPLAVLHSRGASYPRSFHCFLNSPVR